MTTDTRPPLPDTTQQLMLAAQYVLQTLYTPPSGSETSLSEAVNRIAAAVQADYAVFHINPFCPAQRGEQHHCQTDCTFSESPPQLCTLVPAVAGWLQHRPATESVHTLMVADLPYGGQTYRSAALTLVRLPAPHGAALLFVGHRHTPYTWSPTEQAILSMLGGLFGLLHQCSHATYRAAETEDDYRKAMDASAEAILVHTHDRILFGNLAATKLLGVTDFDAPPSRSFLTFFAQDDQSKVLARTALVQAGVPDVAAPLNLALCDTQGQMHTVELRTQPFTYRDEAVAWTTLRDVSRLHVLTQQLHLSEAYLDQILNRLPLILWAVDSTNRFTLSVGAGRHALPPPLSITEGVQVEDGLPNMPELLEQIDLARGGQRFSALHRIGALWLETYYAPITDEQGGAGVIALSLNVTDREHANEQLQLAAQVFQYSGEGIVITDTDGHILAINQAFERITGYGPEEAIGQTPSLMASGYQATDFYKNMWVLLQENGCWVGEIWNRRKSGEVYPEWLSITAIQNGEGQVYRYIGIFTDITTRKEKDRAIYQLSNYDSLTHLPNRNLFNDRATALLAQEVARGGVATMLYIDLDGFKLANDAAGAQAGDAMLVSIAQRLQACLCDSAPLARLESDHFLILHTGSDWHSVVDRVLLALREPHNFPDRTIHLTASVGVSRFPADADTVGVLTQHAESAMQAAKTQGGDCFALFEQDISTRAAERFTIYNELKYATAKKQFCLFLQPQFHVEKDGSQTLLGAESLIRWQHPQWGLVSPVRFIPIAEESHLIHEISEWVLEEACRIRATWPTPRYGDPFLALAINLSPSHFQDPALPEKVSAALARHGLPPCALELEVTERTVIGDIDAIIGILFELKAIGVRLAIDDFGTGYSSLSYLRHFPINRLKIDRSFISDLMNDSSAAAIVDTILTLAGNLGVEAIAEGVETEAQRDALTAVGCRNMQGYLLGRPCPEAEFEAHYLAGLRDEDLGLDLV